VVLDPVMVATSGATLADSPAVEAIVAHLLPLAEIVTPNIPEAEVLAGVSIATREDREAAARAIQDKMQAGKWVLIKGGHAA
jgi:hydroxymethylpyrimidine/phosphomethylpyrimidine kinase